MFLLNCIFFLASRTAHTNHDTHNKVIQPSVIKQQTKYNLLMVYETHLCVGITGCIILFSINYLIHFFFIFCFTICFFLLMLHIIQAFNFITLHFFKGFELFRRFCLIIQSLAFSAIPMCRWALFSI